MTQIIPYLVGFCSGRLIVYAIRTMPPADAICVVVVLVCLLMSTVVAQHYTIQLYHRAKGEKDAS